MVLEISTAMSKWNQILSTCFVSIRLRLLVALLPFYFSTKCHGNVGAERSYFSFLRD